jgi:hypothetical protein
VTLTLSISTDFADVVDGLSSVQYTPRGSSTPTAVANSLRRAISVREAAASDGKYTTNDVAFHLQNAVVVQGSVVGATIDDGGTIYTVLDAHYETLASRWRCISRRVVVLTGTADIYLTSWTKGASGAQEPTTAVFASGVAAHIEKIETNPTVIDGQRFTEDVYRIYLSGDYTLTKDHYIVNGPISYKLVSYTPLTLGALSIFQGIVCPFPRAA